MTSFRAEGTAILLLATAYATIAGAQSISVDEALAITKEATIYGFPLVDSYRIQYSYFVDQADPDYKGNWNELHNPARVYTPDDKADWITGQLLKR